MPGVKIRPEPLPAASRASFGLHGYLTRLHGYGRPLPVDITVYLPDDIGAKAKRAELNLSRMLRDAVTDELERMEAMAATLQETEVYEIDLDDGTIGRITGKLLAADDQSGDEVYLTDDERVLFYDASREQVDELDDPAEQLNGLPPEMYSAVAEALGFKPIIDL